jgi:cytochrome P450
MRRLALKAFTPRQAEARADEVAVLANGLIDGFIAERRLDLATAYCQQLPIRVISPVFRVPPEDTQRLYRWSVQTLHLVGTGHQLPREELLELWRGQIEFDEMVREMIAERRKNLLGADDLLSCLITAEDEEGAPALTDSEIVGIVTGGLVAGAETSATTMAHCIQYLLEERSRWEAVVADPTLIPNAIEETLRMNATSRTVTRTTTREVTLGGVTLPRDARLMVYVASGNRDDEQLFPNPNTFDLLRPNARHHLGFGRGIHFCIGAPLARMQIRIAIGALAARLPSLRRVPGPRIEYVPSVQVAPVVRGLVVEWDA